MSPDATDKAIAELWPCNTFVFGARKLVVAPIRSSHQAFGSSFVACKILMVR